MVAFITLTTIVHGILFAYDEYVLHRERSLSKREINSALMDGVLFLSIVALTVFTSYSELLGKIYIALGIFSCLSIIKTEWCYPQLTKKEHLVHAALYVLHPLILYAFYISWQQNFFNTNYMYWSLQLGYFVLGFKAITYHMIYWNYIYEAPKMPLVNPGEEKVNVRLRKGHRYTLDITNGRHRIVSDEPKEHKGDDLGMILNELLISALGSCTAMTMKLYADRKKLNLEEIIVDVKHEKVRTDQKDERGRVIMRDHIYKEIKIEGDISEEQKKRILEIAEMCPVNKTLLAGADIHSSYK